LRCPTSGHQGKVIGTDPTTDIALLKIPVSGLPVVPWGDSNQLKVGSGAGDRSPFS
jgi:S1-C subfamily serine protease